MRRQTTPYLRLSALIPAIFTLFLLPDPVSATEFNFGPVNMTVDNTVSVAASVRTSAQSCDHISLYNGGCRASNGTSYDVNSDDGDVNVERGEFISAPVKFLTEIGAKYQNYGLFVRAKAFYDVAARTLGEGDGKYGPVAAPAHGAPSQRRPLEDAYRGDDAYNLELRQMKLLDAFVYGNFNVVDDLPLNVRVGRQVVNWGESAFILGGVSSFIPLDAASFTRPGTELKEIFLPQNTLYASLGLPANFTVEAMYALEWTRSPLPPCGTFFSPSDALSDGCAYALASGEEYTNADGSIRSTGATPVVIPRGPGQLPRQLGQWGAALRYFADWLNDGTDMGAYFVNFHSTLPIGTFTANKNQLPSPVGDDLGSPLCNVTLPISDDAGQPTRTCTGFFGVSATTGDKRLIAEYPEDIHMIGMSFNTTLDIMNGTAFSGELAYYPNMPFQVDTTELLAADAYNAGFRTQPGQPSIYDGPVVQPGDIIPGYRRTQALHGQVYSISTFTPSNFIVALAHGDLLAFVANAGFQYLPNADGNRFAISRSGQTHANPGVAAVFGDKCIADGTCSLSPRYASTFSWGYRLLALIKYNSFMNTAVNVSPRVFFAHDVDGYSAGPIGPGFIEGIKKIGIGVDLDYQAYKVSVDYSTSFGNRYRNALVDKDFASLSASYAF
jgi:hypothetical protein